MQVLRPITTEDFAALKQIAIESGHGFTMGIHNKNEKHITIPGRETYYDLDPLILGRKNTKY